MIKSDNEIFILPDGRKLGYAVYGNSAGYPVLFFHGIPGSRLQRNPDLAVFRDVNLCIYALDRPGIGLSTYQPNRTLRNWHHDVRDFCHGMRIDRYAVIGVSGGGPYALVCAHELKEQLTHVSVISGLAPIDNLKNFAVLKSRLRLLFKSAQQTPFLLNSLLTILFKVLKVRLDFAFENFVTHLPSSDRILLSQPEIINMFLQDVAEAFRAGSRGIVRDMSILSQPWDFTMKDIEIPVHIWHSRQDTIVPFVLAQYLHQQLPYSELHVIEQGGHFVALDQTSMIFSEIQKSF